MLQRLRERSLDLLISRSRLHAPEMEVCPILHEPLLVALPPAHPLGQRHSILLEELKGERFLIHRSSADSGLYEVEMQACQQAGFVPNVVYLGGETIPMLLMVQQGLGVAFAPYSFAKLQLAQQMHMVPLEEPVLTTCLNLIWSKQHVLAPAAERVRRFVVQTFGST